MQTTSRRLALLSASVLAAIAGSSRAAEPFLTTNDFAIAIDAIPSFFLDDTNSGGTSGMYPFPGETPSMMFDGDLNTKFLNFGRRGAGFIVTPGTSTARSFRLSTANDAPDRDPTSYVLLGTNQSIVSEDRSNGLGGETWTVIQSGTVVLPNARSTNGPVIDLTNTTAYSSYKLYFPTLKQPASSNPGCMQLSEVQLWDQAGGTGNAILNSSNDVRAIDNPGPESSYNTGERPQMSFDRNVNTKYRNALNGANGNQDGHAGAGLIVTPKRGQTILQSFQIATANDNPVRDPTSYEIYGTNSAIASADNSDGTGESWTLIGSGSLSLPAARLTFGSVITLSNTTAYASYKVVFPTTGATRNSMQISELKFVGDLISPSEWLTNANGDWNNPDNWIGELPNGVGKTARLFNKSTSSHTIFTETGITLGTLRIENTSPYQITGAGSLTMQVSSGAASINVSGAAHKINVPLTIASNTTITVAGGATLKISDPVTVNAGKTITQTGNIVYESTVDVLPGAGIEVRGGESSEINVLKFRENANGTLAMGGSSALRANALLLDNTSRLDVVNNGVVTGTDRSTVQSLVASARNGNASARWSGPGITSSFAAGHAATGLAVLSGSQYQFAGGTTFMGQAFSASDTLVKHTWNGDSDLDGAVTLTDYSRTDAGFQNGGDDWFHGDFSYDGQVNFDDYALIDGAFQVQNGTIGRALTYIDGTDRSDNGMSDPGLRLVQQHFAQFGEAYASAFLNAVPEPSGALVLCGLAAASKRRRRS